MEELNYSDVVAEILARFQMRINDKRLVCDIRVPKLALIRSDRRMLTHIVSNLVDNAIKYNHEGGSIRVALRRDAEFWLLEISDTGVGIAHDELPRVFERFWRADRSRTRSTGGVGLGLAIVNQLVTQLRGTMTVDSEEGKGSTFTVKLSVGL